MTTMTKQPTPQTLADVSALAVDIDEQIAVDDAYAPVSLEEFDEEFFAQPEIQPQACKGRQPSTKKVLKLKACVTGFAFYTIIAALVFGFYFLSSSTDSGVPRDVGGFAVMTVLTDSMQSEIPKDSLIITRVTSADEIRIGDDITFLQSANMTVTHRVVGIYENHAGTGERGFRTQGIMNPVPDLEIVPATNVIGRVVWSNLFFGRVTTFISANVIPIGIITALLVGLIITLNYLLKSRKSEKKHISAFALPHLKGN